MDGKIAPGVKAADTKEENRDPLSGKANRPELRENPRAKDPKDHQERQARAEKHGSIVLRIGKGPAQKRHASNHSRQQ